MILEHERRDKRSPTKLLTAGFWIVTVMFVYWLIGIPDGWAWLGFLGAGVTLTYFWWQRRRRGRYAVLFGVSCAFCAAVLLAICGAAVLDTISAPVDSVGSRRVICGSVANPVPADELTVTTTGTGESVVWSSPISHESLQRICSNRLENRCGGAAGMALVGLLLATRAFGHLVTPTGRSSAGTATP